MHLRSIVLAAAIFAVPGLTYAQFDFHVAGRDVQVHSFASQGFMYSNQNNYMSMPTSDGSFAFTDGGANISTRITDKFRVGAQFYLRNIGELGNWKPTIDWMMGDYRFKSWFGFRAGRVKTTLGLYNDVQDMDSLHTFALLPSSIYPIDWRSATIAHDGGDFYGNIDVKHLGTFSYTAWAGMRPQDSTQGYIYSAKGLGIKLDELGGRQAGGDLRWAMPFGLQVGMSYLDEDISGTGTYNNGPYSQSTKTDEIAQYYTQYTYKGLRLDAEYRRNIRDITLNLGTRLQNSIVDQRDWYVAGTYRISKRLEVGAYRSEYYVDDRKDTSPAGQHEFDTVVSGRVNLVNRWYVKVEGHFIDGAPTAGSAARGFYTLSNPGGILPTTNLLVVRTGISF